MRRTVLMVQFLVLGAVCTASSSAFAQTRPVGWLDRVDSTGVAWGWTADRDSISQSLWVHFYVAEAGGKGRRFAGAARANGQRKDVELAGYPGRHGFRFTLPAWARDGRSRPSSALRGA